MNKLMWNSDYGALGAGLEPPAPYFANYGYGAFGCLRHRKGCTSYECLEGCPMSPTRYQLRHPGLVSREASTL